MDINIIITAILNEDKSAGEMVSSNCINTMVKMIRTQETMADFIESDTRNVPKCTNKDCWGGNRFAIKEMKSHLNNLIDRHEQTFGTVSF